MPLDVWVGDPRDPSSGYAVSFEPEAYYWFVHPLVEKLKERHGKYFDPYQGCEFEPTELHLFQALIDDADALAEHKPEKFSVHVGTQIKPVAQDWYVEVDRGDLRSFLDSLRDAAGRCERKGMALHLFGD